MNARSSPMESGRASIISVIATSTSSNRKAFFFCVGDLFGVEGIEPLAFAARGLLGRIGGKSDGVLARSVWGGHEE